MWSAGMCSIHPRHQSGEDACSTPRLQHSAPAAVALTIIEARAHSMSHRRGSFDGELYAPHTRTTRTHTIMERDISAPR
jgi:hypothetical protein